MLVATGVQSSEKEKEPCVLIQEQVVHEERVHVKHVLPVSVLVCSQLPLIQVWILYLFQIDKLVLSDLRQMQLVRLSLPAYSLFNALEESWVLHFISFHLLDGPFFALPVSYDLQQL